jgi:hypothetical protein
MDTKHLAEAQAVLRENEMADYLTPWIGNTARLLAEHPGDPYSDWCGWKEYMGDRLNTCEKVKCEGCGKCETFDWWDRLDPLWQTTVYAEMLDACRQVAEVMGWKDVSVTTGKVKE